MIWKVAGTAAVGILGCALIRSYKPEYVLLAEAASAVALLWVISGELQTVLSFFSAALGQTGEALSFAGILMKVLGVALITQFSADAARDNAQQALAHGIEFAGKTLILALALPVLKAVLQMISEFAENL